jgi:hypothetical protein
MFEDAKLLSDTYKSYIGALQNKMISGSPEMYELQRVFRAYDVDLNEVSASFDYFLSNPEGSLLDLMIGALAPRGDTDHFLNERQGLKIDISAVDKQALENILHFMSAIEVMEAQNEAKRTKTTQE